MQPKFGSLILSFWFLIFWGGDPGITRTQTAVAHPFLDGLSWNLVYRIACTMSRCNLSLGAWRSVLVFLFCRWWPRHDQKMTEIQTAISHLLLNSLPWKLAYILAYTMSKCNQSLGAWSLILVLLFWGWWPELAQKLEKFEPSWLIHFSTVCYGTWWM